MWRTKHELDFNFGPLDKVVLKVKGVKGSEFEAPDYIVVDGVMYERNKIGTHNLGMITEINHHSYWRLK